MFALGIAGGPSEAVASSLAFRGIIKVFITVGAQGVSGIDVGWSTKELVMSGERHGSL